MSESKGNMENQPTLSKDSALARGIRTAVQAAVGFFIGLIVVVWNVPGVPSAVVNYLAENAFPFALALGLPAGLVSFVWNVLRKDVPNI